MSTFLAATHKRGEKNIVNDTNDMQLGMEGILPDEALANGAGQLTRTVSQMSVRCRLVRYEDPAGSNTTPLVPGKGVKFKVNKFGQVVDGLSTATSGCAGIIDPWLTQNVVHNDTFLLITGGPCDIEVTGAIATQFIKPAAAGQFAVGTLGNSVAKPLEDITASPADDVVRAFVDFNVNT